MYCYICLTVLLLISQTTVVSNQRLWLHEVWDQESWLSMIYECGWHTSRCNGVNSSLFFFLFLLEKHAYTGNFVELPHSLLVLLLNCVVLIKLRKKTVTFYGESIWTHLCPWKNLLSIVKLLLLHFRAARSHLIVESCCLYAWVYSRILTPAGPLLWLSGHQKSWKFI